MRAKGIFGKDCQSWGKDRGLLKIFMHPTDQLKIKPLIPAWIHP